MVTFKETRKKRLQPLTELVSLKEKDALIMGAGKGIGAAIACRLAEAGLTLNFWISTKKDSKKVKEDLRPFNSKIVIHKINLSSKDEIDAFWSKIEGKEPDILINNAGIYPAKSFLDVDEVFLKQVMDVNLNAVFWMCQHVIRARIKKGGTIINTGSIEAVMPLKEGMSHYDVSKAGVMVLSRALASEYGKHGFRTNVLVPGGVSTQGTKNVAKDAMKFKTSVIKCGIDYGMRTPLGRMGNLMRLPAWLWS